MTRICTSRSASRSPLVEFRRSLPVACRRGRPDTVGCPRGALRSVYFDFHDSSLAGTRKNASPKATVIPR